MGTIGSISSSAVALPTTMISLGGSSTARRTPTVSIEAVDRAERELASPGVQKFVRLVTSMRESLGPTATQGAALDAVGAMFVGLDPKDNPLGDTLVGGAVDRTNSTISTAMLALAGDGRDSSGREGVERARDAFSNALQPFDGSPSTYDANDAVLGELEARYKRRLAESADPAAVTNLVIVQMLRGANSREREKLELLKSIMISLWLGQVPDHLIGRARELGLGHIVEQMVANIVGRGQGLSKGNALALKQLGFSAVEPEHTDVALDEHRREQEAIRFRLKDGREVNTFGAQVPGQVGARWREASARQGIATAVSVTTPV